MRHLRSDDLSPQDRDVAATTGAGLSLRSILTTATLLGVALALVAAVALVGLTTLLRRTTESAANAVESVRFAEEAEVELLLYGRATTALGRRDRKERIWRHMAETRRYVTTETERQLLADAESRLVAYIGPVREHAPTAGEDDEHLESAAFGALEALVEINVTQARAASAAAMSWNRRADLVGFGVAALVLIAAAGVIVWLQRRAFVPVFGLADAMRRFGQGDRAARAPETGPTELRLMGRRFNEMADGIAAQRQAQVAFLGGVAHDLRGPLAVLGMFEALLPTDEPLPPEPRLRVMIARAARQVTRLERMANDFVDISKIEADRLELKLARHDARALVEDVVALFTGMEPTPHLIVGLPDEAALVRCDQIRMEQVLTNLLSNAIKYSPPGSPIEVAVEPNVDEVVVRVTDHGIGIAEPDQERVFEPFRRVGLSKETVPGVGLGLHIVRRLVEGQGGRVEVVSAPGRGSTFRVRLPRAADADALAGRGDDEPSRVVH